MVVIRHPAFIFEGFKAGYSEARAGIEVLLPVNYVPNDHIIQDVCCPNRKFLEKTL